MPDSITKITDLIVPEIYNPYFIQQTVKTNAFLNSGIATSDPSVKFDNGGKTVNIPFFESLKNGVEVLKDATAMTIHKITANKDVAAVHTRGVTYAASDLSAFFSGSDPLSAITLQLANVWSEEYTKVVLSTLKGIFGVAGMADSISDQSTKVLTADIMADALYLLGDNYQKLQQLQCILVYLQNLNNSTLLINNFLLN